MKLAVSFNGSRALESEEVQEQTGLLKSLGLFNCVLNHENQSSQNAGRAVRRLSAMKVVGEVLAPLGSPHPLLVSDLKLAGRLEVDAQWQ